MAKNPLQIILEMIVLIIRSGVSLITGIFDKLIELFVSLGFIAGTGLGGLIIASVIFGVVLFLVLKFVFGTTVSLVKIFLIYAILVILIVLFVMI